MSSYQIKFTLDYIVDKNLNVSNEFISLENGILTFKELDFTDFIYFHVHKDSIYLQLHLKNENQTDFQRYIKFLTLNEQNISFDNLTGIKFENCSIDNFYLAQDSNIKTMQFISSSINGEFSLQDKQNIEVLLDRVVFEKYVQFQRSSFKKLEIKTSTFKEIVNFEDCTCANIILEYATFINYTNFSGVIIKDSLDLTKTFFKESPNFINIRSGNKQSLHHYNLANRETARIIKHSFEKRNSTIEANKFYALEMKAMWKELKFIKQPLNWIVFFLHGLSSNHSQNYLLPILWMLLISFVFCDGCNLIQNSFIESIFSIYYSNITSCIAKSIFIIEKEFFSIATLIYKSIIAYLIYQFIISIRQNTRRK